MISDMLLPEFDQEMATTRKYLERVPLDKYGWKAHEKSFSLGVAANHLANLVGWTASLLTTDSLDLAPAGQPPMQAAEATNREELLANFDKNVADGRAAIAATSDEDFGKPWSLLMTGNVLFTQPRLAVMRGMVMNHVIHHRAQLGVYLRLLDVPLPSTYGPTADEQFMHA